MNSWFLFLEPTVAEVVNKKNIILLKYLLILSLSVMLYSLSFLIFLYLSSLFLFWSLSISSLLDWCGGGRHGLEDGVDDMPVCGCVQRPPLQSHQFSLFSLSLTLILSLSLPLMLSLRLWV